MILRKNISLNEEYLRKLEPLMLKHKGNLSAVIREVIDLADAAFQDPDSVKRLISGLKKEHNLTSSTLIWALKNLDGRLPDEETMHNIIDNSISSLSSLEERLNELGSEIYWNSSVKISSDSDFQPGNVQVSVTGKNPDITKFISAIIALYLVKKYDLNVTERRNMNGSFEVKMAKSQNGRSLESVINNFGYLEEVFSELYKKKDLWSVLIPLHMKMNYDMVTISKQLFEDILSGNATPRITTCIERFSGNPIKLMSHEDFVRKIKLLYQAMGLIKDMEINQDSLIIHHGLSDPTAIRRMGDMFVDLMRSNGQTYTVSSGNNLIILNRLPEMGKILVQMVEDFKERDEPLFDYHAELSKMLNMLKNVPSNEEFIRSLGGKFGKKIIQQYEKDKKIKMWDAQNFLNYMQDMSAAMKQNSNWSVISKNVLHGKIAACPLIRNETGVEIANCHFIKGLYDEWITHSFGEQIERVHEMSQSEVSGNQSCEIYVAFK